MDKKARNTIIISIIGLALVLITVTYAYFAAHITGIESASTISLNAGVMNINFVEGNELVTASNMFPREEAWITKTFTLIGTNTTSQVMEYEVGLDIISNTFKGGQLSFGLEVGQNNDGTSMPAVTNRAIVKSSGVMLIGRGSFQGPITNGTQTYTLKIYFKDNGKNQNINQGATFNARIIVGENLIDNSLAVNRRAVPSNPCTDTEHTTLTQGDEYVNGQYTYHYMEESRTLISSQPLRWGSISDDGWGVALTDRSSTSPVTSQLCTSINGKPIVSMTKMFASSAATSIDLSSFDTSNVTDMSWMFTNSSAASLDLSTFNTSNVTNMTAMFRASHASTLDLRTFDTSNVTQMGGMFENVGTSTINISSFDTSKVQSMNNFLASEYISQVIGLDVLDTSSVTDMEGMFGATTFTSLDLSNFNTSNVTNMSRMFAYSTISNLNLTYLDTSNVTNMEEMFSYNMSSTIDMSSFDTSNVTNMYSMFANSAATTLDLSSFDTSSVTEMGSMFEGAHVHTIYVSNKFVTTSLAADSQSGGVSYGSYNMFNLATYIVGGAGTTYDANNVNKAYAHIDGGQSNRGYFTDIADRPSS